MKKRILKLVFPQLILAALLVACGRGSNQSIDSTVSEESDYVALSDLQGCTVEELEIAEPQLAETEVQGDEATSTKYANQSVNIYSKPDEAASKLGSLSAGASVRVIAGDNATDYLQIVYNGRVAYAMATSFTDTAPAAEAPLEQAPAEGENAEENGENTEQSPEASPEASAEQTPEQTAEQAAAPEATPEATAEQAAEASAESTEQAAPEAQ